jgi:CBS-domain-containing membrane protein
MPRADANSAARDERAAVRWHSRFCAEARNVRHEDAQLALAALAALRGVHPESGARSLMALFDGLVMTQ